MECNLSRAGNKLPTNVCVYDGLGLGGFVNDFKNVKADQSTFSAYPNLVKKLKGIRTRITQVDINILLCAVRPRSMLRNVLLSTVEKFSSEILSALRNNVCVYGGLGLGGFVNDFKNVKADQSTFSAYPNLVKKLKGIRTRITQVDINILLCAVRPRSMLRNVLLSTVEKFSSEILSALRNNVCVYDGLGLGGFVK